jgi:hypothetical protein
MQTRLIDQSKNAPADGIVISRFRLGDDIGEWKSARFGFGFPVSSGSAGECVVIDLFGRFGVSSSEEEECQQDSDQGCSDDAADDCAC